MTAKKGSGLDMHRPLALWPLLFLLLFLALGGLYGGIAMLTDPTGGSLQLTEVLPLLPVADFILPGVFLLVMMGLVPLLLIYGLLACPKWDWSLALPYLGKYHWSWIGTVGLAVVLGIWLLVQGALIGFKWPIQYVTAINGILIVLLALVPNVRKRYRSSSPHTKLADHVVS
ncbi:hypothetical protein ACFL3F_05015 [Planctomycetota bacterium]